jgi:hypothetical protein
MSLTEIVDDNNIITAGRELVCRDAADVPCSLGYDDSHGPSRVL